MRKNEKNKNKLVYGISTLVMAVLLLLMLVNREMIHNDWITRVVCILLIVCIPIQVYHFVKTRA